MLCAASERRWPAHYALGQQLQKVTGRLWTFLETRGIEPSDNPAVDEVFSAGVLALASQSLI